MSKENRPNFNAAKFAADIVISYFNSYRGPGEAPLPPSKVIPSFVEMVNDYVDEVVERRVASPKGDDDFDPLAFLSAEGFKEDK